MRLKRDVYMLLTENMSSIIQNPHFTAKTVNGFAF